MKIKDWKARIAERNDITRNLIHLTKPKQDNGNKIDAYDVLLKILRERKLIGSTTEGYIIGDRKAVCLQESPIYSLSQNVYYE